MIEDDGAQKKAEKQTVQNSGYENFSGTPASAPSIGDATSSGITPASAPSIEDSEPSILETNLTSGMSQADSITCHNPYIMSQHSTPNSESFAPTENPRETEQHSNIRESQKSTSDSSNTSEEDDPTDNDAGTESSTTYDYTSAEAVDERFKSNMKKLKHTKSVLECIELCHYFKDTNHPKILMEAANKLTSKLARKEKKHWLLIVKELKSLGLEKHAKGCAQFMKSHCSACLKNQDASMLIQTVESLLIVDHDGFEILQLIYNANFIGNSDTSFILFAELFKRFNHLLPDHHLFGLTRNLNDKLFEFAQSKSVDLFIGFYEAQMKEKVPASILEIFIKRRGDYLKTHALDPKSSLISENALSEAMQIIHYMNPHDACDLMHAVFSLKKQIIAHLPFSVISHVVTTETPQFSQEFCKEFEKCLQKFDYCYYFKVDDHKQLFDALSSFSDVSLKKKVFTPAKIKEKQENFLKLLFAKANFTRRIYLVPDFQKNGFKALAEEGRKELISGIAKLVRGGDILAYLRVSLENSWHNEILLLAPKCSEKAKQCPCGNYQINAAISALNKFGWISEAKTIAKDCIDAFKFKTEEFFDLKSKLKNELGWKREEDEMSQKLKSLPELPAGYRKHSTLFVENS